MRIQSLQLSGFKGFDQNTTINFLDEHQNLVFEAQGDESQFFIHAILGIIFGMTAEEKLLFRGDPRINQTFTGMVSLAIDHKILLIERDFETDVIACLLTDPQSSRPIFQGKDIVDNGFSRPYLDMLRSIFPIVDKSLYLEILNEEIAEGKPFSELLNSLYLLFSPSFNLNKVQSLLNQIETVSNEVLPGKFDTNDIQQLSRFKDFLLILQKANALRNELIDNLNKLNHLTQKIRQKHLHKDEVHKKLEESFELIKDQNPILLRAEVLLWKSLEQLKAQNEAELKEVESRMASIEQTLKIDLAEYDQLPPEADRDIKTYHENKNKIEKLKKSIEELQVQIRLNEVKFKTWKNVKLFFIGVVTPLSFILSYVAFNSWLLIIPEAFFFLLIFLFLFGHYHTKIREKLLNLQEDQDILVKKMNDLKRDQQKLQEKWYFLKDEKHFQMHKERLLRYKELKSNYRHLKQQAQRLKESLEQPSFNEQLTNFRKKYQHLIDIKRPDLESYLDKFVAIKSELNAMQMKTPEPPIIKELQKITHEYRLAIQNLKQAYNSISDRLNLHQYNMPIDQILDAVDRKIKNIALKSGIPFEY
ncbi:hypothetical protein ACX8XP_00605 [Calditrichota bacterium LG25]